LLLRDGLDHCQRFYTLARALSRRGCRRGRSRSLVPKALTMDMLHATLVERWSSRASGRVPSGC